MLSINQIFLIGDNEMNSNFKIQALLENIEQVIIGKRSVILKVIAAMLCNDHVLIEDVPGVGKTQLVIALARSVQGKFNRIQLTPDVMPSDIIGFTMIGAEDKMTYRPGVAICNFLLADEINRASPKSQSSLLEIMEEHQISIEGKTIPLPKPFMTLATQNPVETYGTYHLPEAQLDRFIMKISMGYPSMNEEMLILDNMDGQNQINNLEAVLSLEDVLDLQNEVSQVTVHRLVKDYILRIVYATRSDVNIKLGVSPRGSIALQKASKAIAYINGRSFVTPDDVISIAPSVLSHRIMLSPKGKSDHVSQEAVIQNILDKIQAPVPMK